MPPDFRYGVRDRYVGGVRMHRARLAAARVHGDSMIYRDVFDGDIAIFQRSDFDYVENGKVVVIEKVGEEEGLGAWALKKLVIERPRSSHRSEYEDEIDWDNPVIVLHSYNPRVSSRRLDPSGQYRVHGLSFDQYGAMMPVLWIRIGFDASLRLKNSPGFRRDAGGELL